MKHLTLKLIKEMLRYFKAVYGLILSFSIPAISFAAIAPTNPVPSTGGTSGAGSASYQPISGVNFGGSGFGGMLSQLFVWGVTLAIILAIIMLVVGGVQYMGSESLFGKDEGKKRIVAALGGLMIALTSIFILNLILGTGGAGPFKVF